MITPIRNLLADLLAGGRGEAEMLPPTVMGLPASAATKPTRVRSVTRWPAMARLAAMPGPTEPAPMTVAVIVVMPHLAGAGAPSHEPISAACARSVSTSKPQTAR